MQIGSALGVTDRTAGKWRNRFAEHRLDGLDDEPRAGRPRRTGDDAVAEAVRKTLEDEPRDIVGPYVDPPQHAMVLCVDGKSQVQALDRSQPPLPQDTRNHCRKHFITLRTSESGQ